LVRAYGGACQEALDLAEIIEVTLTRRVSIAFDYALSSAVQAVVAAVGFEPVESNYGERVTICFDVPEGQVESFVSELRERSANQITIEIADSEFR
jgi:putative IMPACT (imprinted ancient) family translation regulator